MKNNDLSILQPYCNNGMKRLKQITRTVLRHFKEPLAYADYDDFYSLANMILWQAYNKYDTDMGITFDLFLRCCLKKRFSTEIRDRHRQKRVINQLTYPLEDDSEDELSLAERIPADFDMLREIEERQRSYQYEDKTKIYISRLSMEQVNILNLLIDGYDQSEIVKKLNMPDRRYRENMQIMRSYENIKVLF